MRSTRTAVLILRLGTASGAACGTCVPDVPAGAPHLAQKAPLTRAPHFEQIVIITSNASLYANEPEGASYKFVNARRAHQIR